MKIPFLTQAVKPLSKWKKAAHLTSAQTDGQITVIDSQEGKVYHFNGAGAAVWQGLDENANAESLALFVAAQFDAPVSKIRKDIFGFIGELREQDLIEAAESCE